MKTPGLVVTGGGTGGHIFAGVAIADEWKKKYPGSRIVFVGAAGGIEERLVPKAGYPLELVHLGSLKGVSFAKRAKTLVQIPLALLSAAKILMREKPDAVVGVGGYASGPVVLVARILGLFGLAGHARTAILEQNAVPGFTNRILARFSHAVFCAFPGIEDRFQKAKTAITGNPVRNTMVPYASAKRDPFTVFIFGGSQGAVGINSLILDSFEYLRDLLPKLRFIHQTGERDYERVSAGYRKAGIEARVEKFIYDMPDCYREASLVVCRAGSSTLAELAAVHRAAILVPFPFASDNHQEKNARLFVDRGAAELMIQGKSSGKELAAKIRDYFSDPAKVSALETGIAKFHSENATGKIVSLLHPETASS
ncbi:MAG: undecaprenyldiphospho-muramoylpentapeptide beta-N-acetylglucosaminyltransferase [Bdellovibrionales bacterium]|nr:undecaprenyldiphospho-muramoylpentapeptide beta-N-acetylglucosaminyltransferase [Bdellovibrionales bacterium]